MRKMLKKILSIAAAGAFAAGALSVAGCGYSFDALGGNFSAGDPVSNGGFVVEKGEYVYFINGVETYESDNEYGTPVKGALMRIAKSDLAKRENGAEIVIPSLMVAADYSAGIFVYGDRVYYATPNNVESTATGTIERDYLDFNSAKLDGTDIRSYFNVHDNATVYRFVQPEKGGDVYLIYVDSNELHSYNTESGEDVLLAKNIGEYVLNSTDKTDPYIYYTMSVTSNIDVEDGANELPYNQIYRVRADQKECPYEDLRNYEWREDYLENHDGEIPYVNLGEIVLDGIGSNFKNTPTQFNHDLKSGVTPVSPTGFTYTLQAYNNGGLYFTRSELAKTGSVGEDGWLYYLPASKLGSSWNSITGNEKSNLDTIAQSTTNASTSAIFYLDENGGHHYLYVSGSNMFRADVPADSNGIADETLIARGVSGATLSRIDATSNAQYSYVYYTVSGSSGNNVWRAVYNGEEENYKSLGYEASKPYQPVKVLDIEHARSWYPFELVENRLFFADAKALGSKSYNYIAYVDLGQNGTLMNNVELDAFGKKYEEIVGGEEDGYLDTLSEDNANLSAAIRYYFYTGETGAFDENIKEATDAGKKDTYLYSKEDQTAFAEFANGTSDDAKKFVDANGTSYRTQSYFIGKIGTFNEEDQTDYDTYWKNSLQRYTPAETTATGLPAWAWALIGIGIGAVVVGLGVVIWLVLKKRKEENEPEEEKMYVDTTDDRSVDVYSDEPQPAPEEVSEADGELPEAPAETEEAEEAEEAEEPEAASEPETPAEPHEEE